MAIIELDIIKQQSRKLLPKQKLELIKYLAESLNAKKNGQVLNFIGFGKYNETGLRMSNEDDFKIAEWHPTDPNINGD